MESLFAAPDPPAAGERFTELLRRGNVVIERIESGPAPEPVLYDQSQDEWVVLLEGRAVLEIGGERVALGPGEHCFIPAHTRHRVVSTQPQPRCLWLAVHIYPAESLAGEERP